mgnify:CR=1 FL=1
MAVLKSINEFPNNAMDVLQDIDEYKKFCRENKLPFREHHLYKAYTHLGKYSTTLERQDKLICHFGSMKRNDLYC